MSNTMTNWGWTSYKRTGWIHASNRRIYSANFMAVGLDENELGYAKCRVMFAALHPILALRAIVDSGKDPLDFDDTVIN